MAQCADLLKTKMRYNIPNLIQHLQTLIKIRHTEYYFMFSIHIYIFQFDTFTGVSIAQCSNRKIQ